MTESQSSSDDLLVRLVVEASRHGADELEIEYRDGWEQVCVIKNGIGFGIASLDSTGEEAEILREQLCEIAGAARSLSQRKGAFV